MVSTLPFAAIFGGLGGRGRGGRGVSFFSVGSAHPPVPIVGIQRRIQLTLHVNVRMCRRRGERNLTGWERYGDTNRENSNR